MLRIFQPLDFLFLSFNVSGSIKLVLCSGERDFQVSKYRGTFDHFQWNVKLLTVKLQLNCCGNLKFYVKFCVLPIKLSTIIFLFNVDF